MDKNDEIVTKIWTEYEQIKDYKLRINLYSKIDENYRYYEGDQWGGIDTNGLPQPVFNIIKQITNYKISNITQSSIKVVYACNNYDDADLLQLQEVTQKLTSYADRLRENLKLDYLDEDIIRDSAIAGDSLMYFYFNEKTNEVACEQLDVTNVYPSNPNKEDIQDQEFIIISFRRPLNEVKELAKENGVKDIENITSDTDYEYEASENAKKEVDDKHGKCNVLLKFWKDRKTKTVHYSRATKGCVIEGDVDTGLELYPIAKMTWEKRKNCFFGISDVEVLIPNQDYVNTMIAMIMLSATFYSFPKMVYNENLCDVPDNTIGTAIAVNGTDMNVRNIIDYISPGQMSTDAFKSVEFTIQQTKEVSGANDGALGNINPEQASGTAINAIIQQSNIPLNSIKVRYYKYVEDTAKIWVDFWRAYTPDEGKKISIINQNGEEEIYLVTKEALAKLMLNTRIDVGPHNAWTEIGLIQTLDSLLQNQFIDFETYVKIMPTGTGFPKEQLQKIIEQKQMAMQQQMQQQQAIEQQAMMEQNANDVVDSIPDELKEQYLKDPRKLQQLIEMQNNATVPQSQ